MSWDKEITSAIATAEKKITRAADPSPSTSNIVAKSKNQEVEAQIEVNMQQRNDIENGGSRLYPMP